MPADVDEARGGEAGELEEEENDGYRENLVGEP